MFKKLCDDDMPMVRRAAAANLGALSKEAKMDKVGTDIPPDGPPASVAVAVLSCIFVCLA